MSEEEIQEQEEKGGGKLWLIVVIALGVLVGVAGGVVLVGPMAAERLAAAPTGGGDGGGHGGGGAETFAVENLVLNPAETGGTRFLMASIVAQVDGEAALSALESREAEVRDHLMGLLGAKTVDELTDVGNRDALKAEIRGALHGLGFDGIEAVFLPTFVIQ
jgi:flagellar FliL protein